MNRIVLLTGVVFGLVAFTISAQMFFSHNVDNYGDTVELKENKNRTNTSLTTRVESNDHEITTHFVIERDTVRKFTGWRPKEK